jgi:O-antigen/teichoic acid export membrane protein
MGRLLNKFKSLLTNEMVYVTADILIKAIAFISLPFFVNVMSTSDFGEFSLYQTYISLFGIFFGLNVSSGIVRYYVEKENQKKYLTTLVWLVLGCGFIFSIITIVVESNFPIIGVPIKALYIICICAIFQNLMSIGLENIRAVLNAPLYGLYSLLSSVMSTSLGLVLVYTMQSELGYWRLISTMVSIVILGGLLTIGIIRRDGFTFKKETARYLLAYSLPLIPYNLSTTIIAQINIIFLADIGLSEVGIYSFASSLAMLMYVVAISLNRAYQPYLFRSLRDGTSYRTRMLRNMCLFYVMYVGFIFGSEILIWIFGNKEYSSAAGVMPIIVLGYGYFFMYSLAVNFFYYYRKNFTISLLSMASAGIILVLNIALIPLYGYYGAAWATVISYFSLFSFSYIYIQIKLKIQVLSMKYLLISQGLLVVPVIIKLIIS